MENMEPRARLSKQDAEKEQERKEIQIYIPPDPESYPGYGWGWHGPWDDEYWDEVGSRPDERW